MDFLESVVFQLVEEQTGETAEARTYPQGQGHQKVRSLGHKGLLHCLQHGIANQQTLLSRYDFNSRGAMTKFKELLLQKPRAEFSALVEEGKAVAKASLQEASDVATTISFVYLCTV